MAEIKSIEKRWVLRARVAQNEVKLRKITLPHGSIVTFTDGSKIINGDNCAACNEMIRG